MRYSQLQKIERLLQPATWEDEEHIRYHTDDSWASEANEFISAINENRKVKKMAVHLMH